MNNNTVTIIGAGIAGLTTAIALQKIEITAHIYEASNSIRPVGAGLGLASNALKAYKAIDLEDEVIQAGKALPGVSIFDEKGKTIIHSQFNAGSKPSNLAIHRGSLHSVLLSKLNPETIHIGKKLKDIQQTSVGVQLFNTEIIKTYLESDFKEGTNESYIYGKIKNQNVGYIYFDYVGDNFFVLADFLEKYEHTNGLIIDLRHNQGGDFTYCFSEIGRLTDQRRYVFKSKTKNGKGQNDYTNWTEWYIEPKGDFINKPIIVLTDRYTISAGERAEMAFMTLPNVTIVGDTTSGAHGTMIGRELANGWFYSLVPQKVELFDGQSYEGIGLAPDVYLKNSTSEINQGIDRTLQYAVDELNY